MRLYSGAVPVLKDPQFTAVCGVWMGQSPAEPYPLPVLHVLYEDRGIKMPFGLEGKPAVAGEWSSPRTIHNIVFIWNFILCLLLQGKGGDT